MKAPDPQVFMAALALVDRRSLPHPASASYQALLYVGAFTLADPAVGREGVIAVAARTVARRAGQRANDMNDAMKALGHRQVLVEHVDRAGSGRPVWSVNGRLDEWDVTWAPGREMALHFLANVGFVSRLGGTQLTLFVPSRGDTQRRPDPLAGRPMAVHTGEFVYRSWGDTQIWTHESDMRDTQTATISALPTMPLGSSKEDPSSLRGQQEKKPVYDEEAGPAALAVCDLIEDLAGQPLHGGPRRRVLRAMADVADPGFVLDELRARRDACRRFMNSVAIVERVTRQGPPADPGPRRPAGDLARRLAEAEDDLQHLMAADYPDAAVAEARAKAEALRAELAALDDEEAAG